MLVTPSGMFMLVKLLQLTKTDSSMFVITFGISMLDILSQLKKAFAPMLVTPSGMLMLVKL